MYIEKYLYIKKSNLSWSKKIERNIREKNEVQRFGEFVKLDKGPGFPG